MDMDMDEGEGQGGGAGFKMHMYTWNTPDFLRPLLLRSNQITSLPLSLSLFLSFWRAQPALCGVVVVVGRLVWCGVVWCGVVVWCVWCVWWHDPISWRVVFLV